MVENVNVSTTIPFPDPSLKAMRIMYTSGNRKLTASPAIPGITSARAIRRLRRFVRVSCSPLARYGPVPRTSASVWVAVIASLLEALGQHQGVLGAPGDGRPVSLREVVCAAREALGREELVADAHGVAHGIARVAQRLHDAV